MKKVFNISALALVFLFCNGTPSFAAARPAVSPFNSCAPEGYILDLTVGGYQGSWTPVAGSSPYTVTVIDLTTNTLHAQFTTPNTSYVFTNLVSGHTYNFTVTKGASVDSLTTTI